MEFNLLRVLRIIVLIVMMESSVVLMKADNIDYSLEIVNHEGKNIRLEDGLTLNFDANGLHYNCNGEQVNLGIDSISKFIYRRVETTNLVTTPSESCKMELKNGCLYVYPKEDGLFTVIDAKGTVLVSQRLTETFVLDLREHAQGIYIARFNNQSYKLTVK